MAAPNTAYQATVAVDDGGTGATSGVSTVLANLFNIDFPDEPIGKVKTTHLSSAGQHHSYIPGWTDCGEVKLTQYWTQAEFARLKGLAGDLHTWIIKLEDTVDGTYTFSGFAQNPKAVKLSVDDEAMMVETTITVCGAIT